MKRCALCPGQGVVPLASFVLLMGFCAQAKLAAAQAVVDEGSIEEPAASSDVEEARARFVRAVSLYHDEQLEAALGEFQASYQINPIPQVLYNIAVVQRDLRRYSDAVDTLRRYIEESTSEPDRRRAVARELLRELETLLGSVRIDCAQTGADLFVDGELAGRTPVEAPLRLNVGQHDVELRLDGFQTFRQSLEVAGGQTLDLDVELVAIRPTWYRTWWFWTSVGGGVVVVTTIAVLAAVLSRPSGAEFGVSVVSGGTQ